MQMESDLNRRHFLGAVVGSVAGVAVAAKSQASEFKAGPDTRIPTVYVQDAVRGEAYLIPGAAMPGFEVTPQSWKEVDRGTVTFVIPDGSLAYPIPPFMQDPVAAPSVLIQHPARKVAYFLKNEALLQFKTAPSQAKPVYDYSFILPVHLELVEKLPAPIKGLLQSGEKQHDRWAK
jgi:uncharacterized membrane protein